MIYSSVDSFLADCNGQVTYHNGVFYSVINNAAFRCRKNSKHFRYALTKLKFKYF